MIKTIKTIVPLALLIAAICGPASAGLLSTFDGFTSAPAVWPGTAPPNNDAYWNSNWYRLAAVDETEASYSNLVSYYAYPFTVPVQADYTVSAINLVNTNPDFFDPDTSEPGTWNAILYIFETGFFKPWITADSPVDQRTAPLATANWSTPSSVTSNLMTGRDYTAVVSGAYPYTYGTFTLNIESDAITNVPEPAGFLLFGLGLAGLPLVKRLR